MSQWTGAYSLKANSTAENCDSLGFKLLAAGEREVLSIRSFLALPLEFARCIGGNSGVPAAEGRKSAWFCAARWCCAVSVQWLDPLEK